MRIETAVASTDPCSESRPPPLANVANAWLARIHDHSQTFRFLRNGVVSVICLAPGFESRIYDWIQCSSVSVEHVQFQRGLQADLMSSPKGGYVGLAGDGAKLSSRASGCSVVIL